MGVEFTRSHRYFRQPSDPRTKHRLTSRLTCHKKKREGGFPIPKGSMGLVDLPTYIWLIFIHGTGILTYIWLIFLCIFTYMFHKNQPNVGNYTSHMNPMGFQVIMSHDFPWVL